MIITKLYIATFIEYIILKIFVYKTSTFNPQVVTEDPLWIRHIVKKSSFCKGLHFYGVETGTDIPGI